MDERWRVWFAGKDHHNTHPWVKLTSSGMWIWTDDKLSATWLTTDQVRQFAKQWHPNFWYEIQVWPMGGHALVPYLLVF